MKVDYLVEWAIALHGMYESALFICFNFKTEEHVNVTSGHNSIFPAARIKYYHEK